MFNIFSIHHQSFSKGNDILDYHNYKEMTFIVTGKLNTVPFLMVDCIRTTIYNGETTYSFTNKLRRMESLTNTFYCIAGDEQLLEAISIYDNWLLTSNYDNDLLTPVDTEKESVKEILEIYKTIFLKKYGMEEVGVSKDQKIFFINSTDVICYTLKLGNLFKVLKIHKGIIQNDRKMDNSIGCFPTEFTTIAPHNTLYDCCKSEIIQLAGGDRFKNKFSFITYENNMPRVIYPYKDIDDIIMDYFRYSYDKI
jgi:hypothetical protein